ncbi:hypothetical protein [Arthrobacter caoxuetaonis]|uniref:hypothetical protein n=1 Tax=Arthrobacter caoxuetaonis TaxID=2886935 RepID=UPI001D137D53|nr:hypothetical protein [Arthrobacter caoxuetaonis]USQ58300.1 hypothetical protein NF551_05545 [Arthrobacter caoxuetaonis]
MIWGIPTIGTPLEVMLLALPPVNGHRRGDLRWARRRLLEPLTTVDGLPVTSKAQTVLDMAAYLPFEQAVPAMDHVIRPDRRRGLQALEKDALRQLAQGLPTQAKRVRAMRVITFADERSESPGESYSRAVIHRNGFPAPELQQSFHSPGGRLLGRTDFFWKQQELVGEFDGAVKYGKTQTDGGTQPEHALLQEKRREDAIRATGVGFLRWSWSEVFKPAGAPDGLVQALLRAGLPQLRPRA